MYPRYRKIPLPKEICREIYTYIIENIPEHVRIHEKNEKIPDNAYKPSLYVEIPKCPSIITDLSINRWNQTRDKTKLDAMDTIKLYIKNNRITDIYPSHTTTDGFCLTLEWGFYRERLVKKTIR